MKFTDVDHWQIEVAVGVFKMKKVGELALDFTMF